MKINPEYIDYAKSGLFMAFGSAVDEAGNKIKVEVTDEDLTKAAELALDYLVGAVFGPDVHLRRI